MPTADRLLNQKSTMATPRVAILVKSQCRYLTFSLTIPTNQEFNRPPVTPYDTQTHLVHTLIMHLPEPTPTIDSTTVIHLLVAQFHAQLEPWQKPLYGPIRKYKKTTYLNDLCKQNQTIILVSDASVQKNKQSGFAWILTNGEQNLWAGVRIAPGTAEDMYSGRAEAFSVLAGLLFFNYYTACFPKTNDTHAQLQCFCDNLGIITNVTEMHKAMIQ